jgi:inorganic triphosphatase YgiF
MIDPREIEAKFEIDRDGSAALKRVDTIGRFTVASRSVVRQDDLYFDTPDSRLAAAGATLRVRRGPTGAVMTFKGNREWASDPGEAHIASRLEDEVDVPVAFADQVSERDPLPDGELSPLTRARELAGAGPYVPTARIDNMRTIVDLVDAPGTRLELAIDHCRGTRLADGRVVEFDEVELEAKGASREIVVEVASAIGGVAPSLRASGITKLERTLR